MYVVIVNWDPPRNKEEFKWLNIFLIPVMSVFRVVNFVIGFDYILVLYSWCPHVKTVFKQGGQ
jgi:hypothetical protein